jgi:hypothetical protein
LPKDSEPRHDEVRRSGGCSLCGLPSDLSKVLVDSKPKW